MASTMSISRLSAQLVSRAAVRPAACPSIASFGSRHRITAFTALSRYYASKSFPSHQVINMPALSPTMTSGNIGAWDKKPGDTLAPGDVLVSIETDKAQMDFEFQDDGVLAKILKEEGSKDVPVGAPIAVLIEEGGDVSAFESFTLDDAGGEAPKKEAPKKESSSEESGSSKDETAESSESAGSGITAQESTSTGARLETSLDRAPKISPAAKRLALEKGVPIGSLKGSGKGGQITTEDIEKFKGGDTQGSAPAGAAVASYEDTPATSMRKTIASRLTESTQKNPHYFVQSTVSVSKLLKLRAALNASAAGAYKLSVNDFLVKALALAALKVPAANSSWMEKGGEVIIRKHNTVDVSVAVSTPIGLMTPIVKGAHAAGLEAISAKVKDLGKRARDGKLKPEEYQGGTITISNMGMNDAIDRFTAVINPPQAAIVAVGTVKKVAVPDTSLDGEAGVKWDEQIVLSGSFDHKVVDGAVGGDFMRELKKIVEDPLKMLL
ncbi:dihydrolipoamide acetyltransferase [Microthyrium microscopicum]|uniref:Acetyltransferase component of pyruvate dehydrogenase complex n=1 Tax=Microthyrium microscopicum TaxID=703497 RepID=A0A6A6TWI9_9PEZI|nr:dihydrolipoamide acetyltransferase [Microthyrium microscopicum]